MVKNVLISGCFILCSLLLSCKGGEETKQPQNTDNQLVDNIIALEKHTVELEKSSEEIEQKSKELEEALKALDDDL